MRVNLLLHLLSKSMHPSCPKPKRELMRLIVKTFFKTKNGPPENGPPKYGPCRKWPYNMATEKNGPEKMALKKMAPKVGSKNSPKMPS